MDQIYGCEDAAWAKACLYKLPTPLQPIKYSTYEAETKSLGTPRVSHYAGIVRIDVTDKKCFFKALAQMIKFYSLE